MSSATSKISKKPETEHFLQSVPRKSGFQHTSCECMCFKSRKKNLLKLMECVSNSETDTDCYVFISRIHYLNVSLHTHCTYNIKHWRWGSLKPNYSFNFLLIFLTWAPLGTCRINPNHHQTYVFFVIFWALDCRSGVSSILVTLRLT